MFNEPLANEIWDNFEILRVVIMPNISYKSCYPLFILQPEKFSYVTPSVYFRRLVSLLRRANCFQSSCFSANAKSGISHVGAKGFKLPDNVVVKGNFKMSARNVGIIKE